MDEIRAQLESEGLLVGKGSVWDLFKEMFKVKSSRKRFGFGMAIAALQQLTGVNAINCESDFCHQAQVLPQTAGCSLAAANDSLTSKSFSLSIWVSVLTFTVSSHC